ncbi:Nuclear pore complex protein [Dictyocoela muelleri]|nr:Nuclear pore complex protein [Dictyocoela muelleri]
MLESKYLAAKQDTRTFSLTNLYSNQIYSSFKTLRPIRDIMLPIAVQKLMIGGKFGFIDENTIWISKDGLWFYDLIENTQEFIANFSVDDIIPISGDMFETSESSGRGILMLTRNNSAIYGFENGTLIETPYKFFLRGKVTCVTSHGATVFIGYDNGLEMIYYNGYGFVSSYCSGYGFFLNRSPLKGKFISADSNFAVYADEYKFHVFCINGKLRHLLTGEIQKYTQNSISGCGIIESKEKFLFFYLMDTENTRIFFSLLNIPAFWKSKQILTYLYTKPGPFSETPEIYSAKRVKISPSHGTKDIPHCLNNTPRGINNNSNSTINDHYITESPKFKENWNFIHEDKIFMFRKNKIALISFNSDQKVNPDTTRAVENFTIIPFRHIARAIMIKKSVYVISENTCHVFKIVSGPEQFINSRPEEVYKLINAFGEKESAVNYLHLIAMGHNVGYSISKMISEAAVYSYFAQILTPLTGDLKDKTRSFYEKIDTIICGLKNILKFKNISAVNELIQALNYLKILREYQPDQLYGDFEKAVFADREFKKRSLSALLDCNADKMLKMLEEKCSGYFSLGQIYHRKGVEILKNHKYMNTLNVLNQSLECFKKSDEDLRPVIKIYNKDKFFTGSATLLKRINFQFLQSIEKSRYLRNSQFKNVENSQFKNVENDKFKNVEVAEIVDSLGCKGALTTFLDDDDEDFVYRVLDAALIKFKNNDFCFLKNECACCTYKKMNEKITIVDFFGINTPFFEKFLRLKFENSSEDYDLLWKFFFYHKRKNEAQAILVRIAEEKTLTIYERYLYFNKAFYIGDYDEEIKRKIALAKIQIEVQDRLQNLSLDEILDEDELFNRYTIPFNFNDLSLKLIDMSDFDNLPALTNIWKNYLTNDYETALENLRKLKIRAGALNIDAIGNALLDIERDGENNDNSRSYKKDLHSLIIEAGFTSSEIKFFYERCMYDNNLNENKKNEILKMIEKYYQDDYERLKCKGNKCFVSE